MPTRKTTAQLLGFTVFQRYSAPVNKVWEAATQSKHLNGFFTNGAKGNISPDMKSVTWRWKGAGSSEVRVTACETGKFFEFRWTAPFNYPTTVRFEFSREKGKTVIRIYEFGWKAAHVDDAFDHCQGWSEFLYGLKAYVQHGLDLRK
jgi:uncharacterized protein YndB with AHSA1/START domain